MVLKPHPNRSIVLHDDGRTERATVRDTGAVREPRASHLTFLFLQNLAPLKMQSVSALFAEGEVKFIAREGDEGRERASTIRLDSEGWQRRRGGGGAASMPKQIEDLMQK